MWRFVGSTKTEEAVESVLEDVGGVYVVRKASLPSVWEVICLSRQVTWKWNRTPPRNSLERDLRRAFCSTTEQLWANAGWSVLNSPRTSANILAGWRLPHTVLSFPFSECIHILWCFSIYSVTNRIFSINMQWIFFRVAISLISHCQLWRFYYKPNIMKINEMILVWKYY